MDRRKFFKIFSGSAAGLTLAGKIALAEDIQKWMLSPQKTIFIPPPKKVEVVGIEFAEMKVYRTDPGSQLYVREANSNQWVKIAEVTEWAYAI